MREAYKTAILQMLDGVSERALRRVYDLVYYLYMGGGGAMTKSSTIRFSPEELVRLSHGVFPSTVRQVFTAHEAFQEEFKEVALDAYIWAAMVATAYRAGRLSMFRDCRKACRLRSMR